MLLPSCNPMNFAVRLPTPDGRHAGRCTSPRGARQPASMRAAGERFSWLRRRESGHAEATYRPDSLKWRVRTQDNGVRLKVTPWKLNTQGGPSDAAAARAVPVRGLVANGANARVAPGPQPTHTRRAVWYCSRGTQRRGIARRPLHTPRLSDAGEISDASLYGEQGGSSQLPRLAVLAGDFPER